MIRAPVAGEDDSREKGADIAAYSIALAREVPENWYELMRPYPEQVETIMTPYGGCLRRYLRHRSEPVWAAWEA